MIADILLGMAVAVPILAVVWLIKMSGFEFDKQTASFLMSMAVLVGVIIAVAVSLGFTYLGSTF